MKVCSTPPAQSLFLNRIQRKKTAKWNHTVQRKIWRIPHWIIWCNNIFVFVATSRDGVYQEPACGCFALHQYVDAGQRKSGKKILNFAHKNIDHCVWKMFSVQSVTEIRNAVAKRVGNFHDNSPWQCQVTRESSCHTACIDYVYVQRLSW